MTTRADLQRERQRLMDRLARTPPRSARRWVLLTDLKHVTARLIRAEIRPKRRRNHKEPGR